VIVDCNVSLGRWPFAKPTVETGQQLDAHLRRHGIDRALVSSADAVLAPEPEECNERLRAALGGFPSLIPVPVLNPRVASAASIMETAGLRALKLIPNYHGYSLADPRALDVCREAARRAVPVMVQMRMEDERGHYEFLKMPGVTTDEITALAAAVPGLSVIALCPYFAEAVVLAKVPGVFVEISFTELPDTLAQLCAAVPASAILFGSHSPLYYTGAAVAKLASAEIGEKERQDIASGNALRILRLPAVS
jgi:predicted TIM-barrel fold metal-dependent hydrolase